MDWLLKIFEKQDSEPEDARPSIENDLENLIVKF